MDAQQTPHNFQLPTHLIFMKTLDLKSLVKTLVPVSILNKLTGNVKIQRYIFSVEYNALLKKKLCRQLVSNAQINSSKNDAHSVRVLLPLIETSHYQYYQLIALAKALELRGAQVKVLICGQSLDGCELKSVCNSNDDDPCWKCRFNEVNVVPLFGLETIKLTDVLSVEVIAKCGVDAKCLVVDEHKEIIRKGVNLSQSVDDSVVRFFYGAVPKDQDQVRKVREAHIKTALMSIEAANYIDDLWAPHVVLSNMPCYSAWEAYFRYFSINSSRFRQISMSAFEFKSVVFNGFELFPANERFEKYLKTRKKPYLAQDELSKLYHFINKRHSGRADIFSRDGYFSQDCRSEDIPEKLYLDKSKRNVFLFTNLYWDIGLSDRKGIFDGVLDWVIQTIEILKSVPQCHLYIKPHPAEVFGSAGSLKGVSDIIRDTYPNGLDNMTIIEPNWKIITYDLFQYIDVGVIFTGTLGLEMMLSGIPVISTGSTSHKGLGFAEEPDSIEAYRIMLLGENNSPKIDKDKLELFSYFYFIRTLIPWTLTKQAYADSFDGFTFESLDDLKPGKDPYLDHLCNCILDSDNTVPEDWPTATISN